MAIFNGKKPIISKETANKLGLTVEPLNSYCLRFHLSRTAALFRIRKSNAYGYKLNGRWFVVTRNGEDLTDVIQ